MRKVTSIVPNRKIAGAPTARPTMASSVNHWRRPSLVVTAATTTAGSASMCVCAAINAMSAPQGAGRRKMFQFVGIAHALYGANHAPVRLDRGRLHDAPRRPHNGARQAADRRKAHSEVVPPPLTGMGPRGLNDEARHTFGPFQHLFRRPYLAAPVDDDADVARE